MSGSRENLRLSFLFLDSDVFQKDSAMLLGNHVRELSRNNDIDDASKDAHAFTAVT